MKASLFFGVFVLLLISGTCMYGKFMRFETEEVPIDRVLQNLQKRLAADTNGVEILYQLARIHSMAFSTNLAVVNIEKRNNDPVFGSPGGSTVPEKIYSPTNIQNEMTAQQHLTNAITFCGRAARLVLKSNNESDRWLILPVHLGYAWCLDQAGRREEAIGAYRNAFQLSWSREVETKGSLGPGICYSEEIIGYLLKLLDPKNDAVEIARLKSFLKKLQTMPRAITPILVPLESDLAFDELVNPAASVAFDLDGSGFKRQWGWITPRGAWLVFDQHDSGHVTSGLQMFGNVTFWIFWRNGYDALSALDDNGDSVLSGGELSGLSLWQDRNGNGVSDSGEVKPLSEFGVIAINCTGSLNSSGILFNPRGIIFQNGTTRPTYDWVVASTKNP
jgi:hypothetical protein